MKLCFPIKTNNGLASSVYGHFGSTPMFLIFDTDSQQTTLIDNQNVNHEHGRCNPAQALGDATVDIVIVGGIGAGAINKLTAMGIKVYQSKGNTVEQNLIEFEQGVLPELSIDKACQQHGRHNHIQL